MRALVAGWFSFEEMGATAGDLLARDVVCGWLDEAGCHTTWRSRRPSPAAWTGARRPARIPPRGLRLRPVRERVAAHRLPAPLRGLPAGRPRPVDAPAARRVESVRPPARARQLPSAHGRTSPSSRQAPARARRRRGPRPPPGRSTAGGAPTSEADGAGRTALLAVDRAGRRSPIDTRLDVNATGLRTAAQVESLDRPHGRRRDDAAARLVLALKNGVPAVAVDPIAGARRSAGRPRRSAGRTPSRSTPRLRRPFGRRSRRACAPRRRSTHPRWRRAAGRPSRPSARRSSPSWPGPTGRDDGADRRRRLHGALPARAGCSRWALQLVVGPQPARARRLGGREERLGALVLRPGPRRDGRRLRYGAAVVERPPRRVRARERAGATLTRAAATTGVRRPACGTPWPRPTFIDAGNARAVAGEAGTRPRTSPSTGSPAGRRSRDERAADEALDPAYDAYFTVGQNVGTPAEHRPERRARVAARPQPGRDGRVRRRAARRRARLHDGHELARARDRRVGRTVLRPEGRRVRALRRPARPLGRARSSSRSAARRCRASAS